MKHKHNIDYIKEVLGKVGNTLPEQVNAYHIGGNALCWHTLKDTTWDTDLVFVDERELKTFEETIQSLGFLRTDESVNYRIGEPHKRYIEIKNTPPRSAIYTRTCS